MVSSALVMLGSLVSLELLVALTMTAGAAIRGHFVGAGGQMLGQHFINCVSCY